MKHGFAREKKAGIVHRSSPQMDTITMTGDSPLGQRSDYPDEYSAGLLFAIERAESRATLGLGGDLPFHGVDIWNAWELTWLATNGQPCVASVEIRVPAESRAIVESKSLKLYLNSFAMSRYDSADEVRGLIRRDLSRCTGAEAEVHMRVPAITEGQATKRLPGDCIDDLDVDCDTWDVDASLLKSDDIEIATESLHSHVLRSLCPVTSQPDLGSILINYSGPKIDRASLLRYIVSFRKHNDFHEACVERIFLDIRKQCRPTKLTVYARYQRRGGIDINPFRSNFESEVPNLRLWRQ
jgi:7-cyano-7-deazaguanine reductase